MPETPPRPIPVLRTVAPRSAAGVLAVAALGLAACSGDGDARARPDDGSAGLAAATTAPAPGPDLGASAAIATLHDAEGREVGTAAFYATPSSGVLIRVALTDAEPGSHAFHLHGTGSCSPDFMAAGGHFNAGGGSHGILHPAGRHTGDLPNLHVPASRALTVDVLAPGVALEEGAAGTLFDEDGSAVMMHRGPDPYTSPPQGSDGERWACGVIAR